MRMVVSLALACMAVAWSHATAMEPVQKTNYMVVYATEGDFEMVREDVELAITGRGIVINNEMHIAEMLERTAGEVADEDAEAIYQNARGLEFCPTGLSRNKMEIDPHTIVFCPYVISVYELAEEPGTIYVSYRRAPPVDDEKSRESLQEFEGLLDELVQESLAF